MMIPTNRLYRLSEQKIPLSFRRDTVDQTGAALLRRVTDNSARHQLQKACELKTCAGLA
jgi:hypothetical protein